jgi:hypothetical protein
MAATVPAYVQALPALHLRRLIASSAAFRTWVGAGSEQAAFDAATFYIDVPTIPVNGKFASLGPPQDDEASFSLSPRGAPNDYAVAGRLEFVLRAPRTTSDSIADQVMDFWNTCGQIIEEMVANSGTTGGLGARLEFTELSGTGPLWSHEDEDQDEAPYILAFYTVVFEDGVV